MQAQPAAMCPFAGPKTLLELEEPLRHLPYYFAGSVAASELNAKSGLILSGQARDVAGYVSRKYARYCQSGAERSRSGRFMERYVAARHLKLLPGFSCRGNLAGGAEESVGGRNPSRHLPRNLIGDADHLLLVGAGLVVEHHSQSAHSAA